MHLKCLTHVKIDLVAVRSKTNPRHPICQFLLPAAALKDKPHQILALYVIVITAEIIREPVRAAVIDAARLYPKSQVFRAE